MRTLTAVLLLSISLVSVFGATPQPITPADSGGTLDQTANVQAAVNKAVVQLVPVVIYRPGYVWHYSGLTNVINDDGTFRCMIIDQSDPSNVKTYGQQSTELMNAVTLNAYDVNLQTLTVTNMVVDIRKYFPIYGGSSDGSQDIRNALCAAMIDAGPDGAVFIPSGDYKLVCGMPIRAKVHKLFGNGKIWISLPADYTNPNVYGVTNAYIAHNQLNSSGILTNWNSSSLDNPEVGYYGQMPWNGKTVIFQDIGSAQNGTVIEDLTFDFGWGTTNAPSSVIPITGVRKSNNETQYYGGFVNCVNTTFKNCRFLNITGAVISHCFNGTVVENCYFGDYGDHIFYTTQEQNVRYVNNLVYVSRETIGTEGQTTFVPQTWRDSVKLRNCQQSIVSGNVHDDATPVRQSVFMTIESSSSVGSTTLTNGCDGILVEDNSIKAFIGILGSSFRSVGISDGDGFFSKNVLIQGNHFDTTAGAFSLPDIACDGWRIANNTFFGHDGGMAVIYGSKSYTNAIRNFWINNNTYLSTNLSSCPIRLGGNIMDLHIVGNAFSDTNLNNSTSLSLVGTVSDVSPAYNATIPTWGRIDIIRNDLTNYYSLWADISYPDWISGQTYTYSTSAYSDGTYVFQSVVRDPTSNLIYTNNSTVTSTTRPGLDTTHWGEYDFGTCYVNFYDNHRYCDSFIGGTFVAYLLGNNTDTLPVKFNYHVRHSGNLNETGTGQPVAYNFYSGTGPSTVTFDSYGSYDYKDRAYYITGVHAGSSNAPSAALQATGAGGIRSEPGAFTGDYNGAYTTVYLPLRETDNALRSNRELRNQVLSYGGSYQQWQVYNGRMSNDLSSPVAIQGDYGRMLALSYDQTGYIQMWANAGTAGGGSNTVVSLDKIAQFGHDGSFVAGPLQLNNLTTSTLVQSDSQKKLSSIPNAAGFPWNNGSGSIVFQRTAVGTGTTVALAPAASNEASLLTWLDLLGGSARGSIGFASNGDTNLTINVNNGYLHPVANGISSGTYAYFDANGNLVSGATPSGTAYAVTNYFLEAGSGVTVVTNVSGTNVTWTISSSSTALGATRGLSLWNMNSNTNGIGSGADASVYALLTPNGNNMEITLPVAGTYDVQAVIELYAPSSFADFFRFTNITAGASASSEFELNGTGSGENSATLNAFVTTSTINNVIQVWGKSLDTTYAAHYLKGPIQFKYVRIE